MATNAFIAGVTINYTDAGGQAALEEVIDAPSIASVLRELVDATHMASGGSKDFIGGLKEGQEFTVTCNHTVTSGATSQVEGFMTDVDNDEQSRAVEVVMTDGTDTLTLTFNVVPLGYGFNPSTDDRNTVDLTMKITGPVTRAYT